MKILLFSKSFTTIQLDHLAKEYGFELAEIYADQVESTSSLYFEKLQGLAKDDKYILTLYPNMLHLKGHDFEKLKAAGSDIRIVNNLEEAMLIAKSKRRNTIVFPSFAFENLVAATAAALIKAKMAGIRNFKILNDLKSEPALLTFLLAQQEDIQGVILLPELANLLGRDKLMELSSRYKVYFATSEPDRLEEKVKKLIQNIQKGNQRQLLHSSIPMKSNAMIEAVVSEVFDQRNGKWEAFGEIEKSKYIIKGMYVDHQVL